MSRVAEYFGFTEADYPAMVIGDLQNESGGIKKYPYSGEVIHSFMYSSILSFDLLYAFFRTLWRA